MSTSLHGQDKPEQIQTNPQLPPTWTTSDLFWPSCSPRCAATRRYFDGENEGKEVRVPTPRSNRHDVFLISGDRFPPQIVFDAACKTTTVQSKWKVVPLPKLCLTNHTNNPDRRPRRVSGERRNIHGRARLSIEHTPCCGHVGHLSDGTTGDCERLRNMTLMILNT